MPELNTLVLNNNRLKGNRPACLVQKGFEEMNLEGNEFVYQNFMEAP